MTTEDKATRTATLEAQLAALPKPDMVSMSEGTIHLDYEDDDARREAYEWLERYAYSSAPEAQQEPDARPAEQAVTEAMVEAALVAWFEEITWSKGMTPKMKGRMLDSMRAALKAAMEAGR